jgi:uncharacterized protein (DUF1800 family)
MNVTSLFLRALATVALAAATSAGGATIATAAPPATQGPGRPVIAAAEAARLLEQSTFGVTESDVKRVQTLGVYGYLDEQLAAAPTQYTGYSYVPPTAPPSCVYDPAAPTSPASLCSRDHYSAFPVQRDFFLHALKNPDQLRQRVAFALSQIFVVSSVEIYEAYGLAAYQNTLLADALGNYRTLLQDVTLSPVMGHYLDMVDNDKTNPRLGTTPNENYAREVLQLFSIGLYELNPDGSQKLDASGAPIPTYDQDVIEGFSSVFTGWTYPPLPGSTSGWVNPVNFDGTMVAFPNHHETTEKRLLGGYTISANQPMQQDLTEALDNIFNHPNVGPFIGKQLIQHLVTSNPSPAYIARVTAVFDDNGKGVRGDLGAVVRAILTDQEAHSTPSPASDLGHLREPALFITSVLRGLGGKTDGVFPRNASTNMGEPVFSAETVFNFYPPSYAIPGTAMLAPEFGIENSATALARANFLNRLIIQGGAAPDPTVAGSTGTTVDLTPLAAAKNPDDLMTMLDQRFMHGTLQDDARAAIEFAVNAVTSTDPLAPARVASYLLLSSAQYQVER